MNWRPGLLSSGTCDKRAALRLCGCFFLVLLVTLLVAGRVEAATPEDLFRAGTSAYKAGNYSQAAVFLREAVMLQPASGTLQNLGNAEWQCGRTGQAILAWEQARWLDPFDEAARSNLRF